MPISATALKELYNKIKGNNDVQALSEFKAIASGSEYTDRLGNTWQVSCDKPDLLTTLSFPIISSNVSLNNQTANMNRTLHCCCIFSHKAKDAQELSITLNLNGVSVEFFHGHDLRTRVFTIHGKPDDLRKFTKDVYEQPAKLKTRLLS